MVRTSVWTAALALLAGTASAETGAAGDRDAFDRLKTLVGTWAGAVVGPDGPPVAVRYELTSGGTVTTRCARSTTWTARPWS